MTNQQQNETVSNANQSEIDMLARQSEHSESIQAQGFQDSPTPTSNLHKKKVRVQVSAGNSNQQFKLVEKVLSKNGFYYSSADELITIGSDKKISISNSIALQVNDLSRLIEFVQVVPDKKGGFEDKIINPPRLIADALVGLNDRSSSPIPRINAVVDHHLFDVNGNLLKSGYNKDSGIYVSSDHTPVIPNKPTKDDAIKALEKIKKIIRTIYFDVPEDHAAGLCAILTASIRPVLETAPLIVISSPSKGASKGLFGKISSRFAENKPQKVAILAGNEDEIQKDLVSRLRKVEPVMFYDEVTNKEIDSPALRSLATSPEMSCRMLGSNTLVELSTRTYVVILGIGVSVKADMTRRVLAIHMDPHCEFPEAKHFDYEPLKDVEKNRDELIDAVLTIQRAYLQSGDHDNFKGTLPAIGSFEDWNKMCRLPIAWLTGIDPATRMLDNLKDDPERNTCDRIFKMWSAAFGDKQTTTKQVIEKANKDPDGDFFDFLKPVATNFKSGKLDTTVFGKWLGRFNGKRVNGLILTKGSKIHGDRTWRVIPIADNETLPPPETEEAE